MIKVKRVYEKIQEDDGKRVLIERLWPRGVKREEAKSRNITLVYSARDKEYNNAVVLKEVIEKLMGGT